MTAEIIEGDCLAVLPTLADASVDAVVCDPPYELKFMSRKWDGTGVAFRPETWAAVLKVLRPGGFLLAFGGTRTYHRMACAIEDAGFEIRDSIACLTWVYGSGFPKSMDISKAIDKAAGAGRNGTGEIVRSGCRAARDGGELVGSATVEQAKWKEITAPATPDAERWAGWGTALKPAHEPIVVARKPLSEGTVAANVLQHGTGGLNVDQCRVKCDGGSPSIHRRKSPCSESMGWRGNGMPKAKDFEQVSASWAEERPGEVAGRYPPNLCLVHHPGCERIGVKRVKTAVNNGSKSRPATHIYNDGWRGDVAAFDYAAPDGTEAVEAWRCVAGCPIRRLNEQAGERKSGLLKAGTRRNTGGGYMGDFPEIAALKDYGGDSGNASRFFPTFAFEADDFAPFLYCAKASRKERNEGLEGMPERIAGAMRGNQTKKPSRTAGDGVTPVQQVRAANHHPTIKPLTLMRWLCRLVTPPGGLILDPFAGSGSTGVAALREGFRFIGIEKVPEYCAIARARLNKAAADRPLLALT